MKTIYKTITENQLFGLEVTVLFLREEQLLKQLKNTSKVKEKKNKITSIHLHLNQTKDSDGVFWRPLR